MRTLVRVGSRTAAHLTTLVVLLAGCGDDTIVYREPFNPPPDAASGFVGYFTTSDKSTTCGNCHVGHERDWQTTRHADAYATLANNPGAQDFCFSCHTVTELGNEQSGQVGWDAVQDTAYHDVQCESCHGPGVDHVEEPDGGTEPLASIRAETNLEYGCGECHSGTHYPFVEEWETSKHATPNAEVIADAVSSPTTYGRCLACHTGQGALQAWGVNAEYRERDEPVANHVGIVCAVCHDPHGSSGEIEGQLRFPVDVPTMEQNLCVKCHNRRGEPETTSATIRGPHSPEGPLLFGEGAGWFPPGFEPQVAEILGTHGTEANPRVCATCHVVNYSVTDQATGDFQIQVVGHTFEAIQCLDANGSPLPAGTECELEQRDFTSGCTLSGCHGTAEAALGAYTTAVARITGLANTIDGLLANPAVAPENNQADGRFTVADGAWFNVQLARLPGSPVHNPFLIEQLLIASEAALRSTYGLPATVRLDQVESLRQLKVDGRGR